uniref:DUF6128 domain-containing protein n=1 Tax=Agathobacter sp. TaxID=2021311 RepID=UPI0040575605
MRRFVTYLYEYDRGNRGKNCGFVRVDVREEEVQMELHMRNCLRCGEEGTIYILVKDEGEILGIKADDINISNGRGEETFQFDKSDIEGSGYSFEQIAGIGIRCENGGYLASNWQDEDYEPLTWGNFSVVGGQAEPMLPENAIPMPIREEPRMPMSSPMLPRGEAENSTPIQSNPERMKAIPLRDEMEASMPIPEQIRTVPFAESMGQVLPTDEGRNQNLQAESMRCTIPEAVMQNQMKQPKTSCSERAENTHKKDMAENISEISIPSWRNQMSSLRTKLEMEKGPQIPPCPRRRIKRRNEFQNRTCMEEPVQKICSYRKITISDIRKLPDSNWYLCNNNFLLHGFFNYNYLVIKKERIGEKEKSYLGVPGVFEKQEKVMAMMFGFPYFESCMQENLDSEEEFVQMQAETEPKEGSFGCWYLVLDM